MKPVDILEMARPEIEARKKRNELILHLRELKKRGMTNDQIVEIIQKLNLPLGLHLHIMGNFSKLIL